MSGRPEPSELLDRGATLDPGDLAQNLDDLATLKRWLGYGRELWQELSGLLRNSAAAGAVILDVATGGADVPATLAAQAQRESLHWRLAGLDRHPQVAEEAHRRLGPAHGVAILCADALRLPLPDGAVDVALCSFTLHHFHWEQARTLLTELWRVSRRGVIVGDLVHAPPAYWAAWALAHLWGPRHRLSRHDGLLSLQRAYTASQARQLAEEAGWEGAVVRRRSPLHFVLLASLRGRSCASS